MERVREAKLLPPALPEVVLDRPRLTALLADVSTRRLLTVIAPAGFGKSTLLASWADRERCAWYTLTDDDRDLEHLFHGVVAALRLRVTGLAEVVRDTAPPVQDRGPDSRLEEGLRANAHAAVLAGALEQRLASHLTLVLDDVHVVDPMTASARFVEALVRQGPPRLHVVALTRRELPFPVARLRAQGQATEISGAMMAFALDESLALAAGVAGDSVAEDAARLHESTLGWPAAVRLGAEALRERAIVPTVADPADRTPETMIDVLAAEVFGGAEPELTALVRSVAPLEGFDAGLCEVLGVADAGEWIQALERRGLVQSHGAQGDGWYTLHPLVQRFAERRLATDAAERIGALRAAAGWLADHGRHREALRCLATAGDLPALASGIRAHGPAIIADGGAEEVLRLIALLPEDAHDALIHQIEGEAHHSVGDWDAALDCFTRLGVDGDLPPSAAWRAGLIHHQRGDLEAALACYDRGQAAAGDAVDRALVLAWSAAARWLRGDLDGCRKLASESLAIAEAHRDHRALAAAHTALAMVAALDGDRRGNDAHYLRALGHAEQAGDVLQLIRIHSNRGSRCLEEGAYHEALQELDAAIDMADLAGFAFLRALALTNRGQVLRRLGRLDEARRDLEAARTHYAHSGAHMLSYPLAHLGDLYAARGERTLARAALEESIRLSEAVGDLQGLVPAQTFLATLLIDTDLDEAARLADAAAAAGPALGRSRSLLAQARVALARGDLRRGRERAAAAAEVARAQRDLSALAEAAELGGRAEVDPRRARQALDEAVAMWRQVGQPIEAARAELALASLLPDPGATERRQTAIAALRAAGAWGHLPPPEEMAASGRTAQVTTLGAFRLTVGGDPVEPADWGSRKPRDLLKLLVARRGGPVRREFLVDQLWPDEVPDRAAKKLSVALSTLRSVLDPLKALGSDDLIAADRDSVWLVTPRWDIDLDRFMADAEEGLRLHQRGDGAALELLRRAEDAFAGEPFDEDMYEDWSGPVRSEARALYTGAVRVLAEEAIGAADHDRAVRLLLRLLEHDAYDEPAHLGLVRSLRADGRHGEARRMYRTYCERMEEVGVEPAPFPLPPPR